MFKNYKNIMRKLFTTCKSLLLGSLVFLGFTAGAQTISGTTGSYQFPQTIGYGVNGRIPSINLNTQSQNALESYNHWKTNFVTGDCGNGRRRVIFDYFPGTTRGNEDRSLTVSEGIAYGMLLSAYAGDKELFDGLWSYYNNFTNDNGVMHFRIRNCNVSGPNGATDAELDAAMALIVASYQWPGQGNYAGDASDLIRIIREKEFNGSIMRPGDKFGGGLGSRGNITNPSYFSPAYYESYKEFDPGQNSFWNAAINKGYDIIEAAQDIKGGNRIGLVPDWTSLDGGFSPDAAFYGFEDNGRNFIFDAVRTPWRTSVDALWHGRERAYDYCTNLTDWAFDKFNGTTVGLGSKFNMQGDQLSNDHNNTFIGCFAMAAMSARPGNGGTHTNSQYQSFLDNAYNDNENTEPGFGQYFNASFKVISQFVMMGNFYKPPGGTCDSPVLNGGAEEISLCDGAVTLNAGVNAGSYQWFRNGSVISGSNRTRTVSNVGVYNVVTTEGNCTRTDNIEITAANIEANFSAQSGGGAINIQNTSTGGISSYSWSLKNSSGVEIETSSEEVPSFSSLASGVYEVELQVSNTCNDSDSKSLSVAIGTGLGLALDDFNNAFNDGLNVYHYGAGFEPLPVKDQGTFTTPDNRCSFVDFVTDGSTPQDFATAEFALIEPLDLSSGAFISIKLVSTTDVTLDVFMGALDPEGRLDGGGNVKTFLATPNRVSLEAGIAQEFTFDYTNVFTGSVDGIATTLPDWSEAKTISLRPFGATPNYSGTLSVDYIVFGDQSLSAPDFNTKLKADGTIDFGQYRPTYFPNDPTFEDCTPSSVGAPCYGIVPDFLPVQVACDPVLTVQSNACLASEVNWYDAGGNFISSGETVDLGPGEYRIDLIGPGGILSRDFEVTDGSLEADFTFTRENFLVNFSNLSSGNTSTSWDFGDPTSLFNSSSSDLPSHFFEGGADDYTVELTVTNTICGTTDTKTEVISVSCDQQPEAITDANVTITEGCEGDEAIVTFTTPAFASSSKVFYPGNTEIADNMNTQTFEITETSNLKIEAYPACPEGTGGIPASVTIPITLVPVPQSGFSANETGPFVTVIPVQAGQTYTWTAAGALNNPPLENTAGDRFFEWSSNGNKEICLITSNICGTAPEVCEEVTIVVTGLSSQEQNGELLVYPTLVENSISVKLKGTANIVVTDLAGKVVSTEVVSDNASLNLSNLSAGAYVLTIELDGETLSKRFIKE